ncbi:MAG: signal peptidase I [Oscillospiraceae bacterium]|nr:signal peptidase I [Oscillospiraceae bacterium]
MEHEDMICILVKELMTDYKTDKTSEEAARVIKSHLNICSECAKYYDSISIKSDESQDIAYGNLAKRLKKRRRIIIISVIFFCLAACIFASAAFPVLLTSGSSMSPTFNDRDYIVSSKLSYLISSPERGDIVIANTENSTVIKRVIGIPGDKVEISDGKLYINSELCSEPYLPDELKSGDITYPVTLCEDQYFLIGDNPDCSNDSRFIRFGSISRKDIYLKVLFSL